MVELIATNVVMITCASQKKRSKCMHACMPNQLGRKEKREGGDRSIISIHETSIAVGTYCWL